MKFRRKKNKIKIEIEFDKETEQGKITALPENTRPTEIIQILMFAINVINQALQEEVKKQEKEEPKKEKKLGYIG